MRARILLVALVVSAGFLTGCSAKDASPLPAIGVRSSSGVATTSPESVVREYWRAVGRHDYKTMDALSTAHWRSELAAATRRWPEAAVRYDMSHLRLAPLKWDGSGRPDYLSHYAAVREYTVNFVQLDDSQTEDAGDQMMFVIAAQETTGAPWRVDGLGTGP